jgi:hypothetical protein
MSEEGSHKEEPTEKIDGSQFVGKSPDAEDPTTVIREEPTQKLSRPDIEKPPAFQEGRAAVPAKDDANDGDTLELRPSNDGNTEWLPLTPAQELLAEGERLTDLTEYVKRTQEEMAARARGNRLTRLFRKLRGGQPPQTPPKNPK